MNTSQPIMPDALAAVQSLTTAQILQRLEELHAERQSLQVLLRAVRARESAHKSTASPKGAS